jgi:hypothetical protein
MTFVAVGVFGYLTDCLRDHAPEAFASVNVSNFLTFGISYLIVLTSHAGFNFAIAKWLISQGPIQVFTVIAGTCIFAMAPALPMYVYGKRIRSWTARKRIFQKILGQENTQDVSSEDNLGERKLNVVNIP